MPNRQPHLETRLAELCADIGAQMAQAQIQQVAAILSSQSHLTWGALRHVVFAPGDIANIVGHILRLHPAQR